MYGGTEDTVVVDLATLRLPPQVAVSQLYFKSSQDTFDSAVLVTEFRCLHLVAVR